MTKERWKALMSAMGIPTSLACFEALCRAYSEKHRFYHTAEHISAMLNHYDEGIDFSDHAGELELAIWFHDAIYRPLSSKNEINSAQWATDFLTENNYNEDGIKRVYGYIMATMHDGDIKSKDEKLMVDIDLTILGAPVKVYDEFEQNVRKEYKWVPWILYKRKREILLQSFLAKSNIYNLNYFQEKYEHRARDNMNRAIQRF